MTPETPFEVALRVVDIAACWTLMAGSLVFLMTRGIETWRQLVLSVGLLLVSVGCFIGAVVIWETGHRAPWAVGQRVGCACVMIWLYDRHYGIRRHLSLLCGWLVDAPERLKQRWDAWLHS